MARDTPRSDSRIATRRGVLAGAVTIGLGAVGTVTLVPEPARAEATLGELAIDDGHETVQQAPSAIDLSVTGRFTIDAPTPPKMVETSLRVAAFDTEETLATAAAFETTNGSFELTADLFEHAAIDAAAVTPDEPGGELVTELVVRIGVAAVADGSVIAETTIEEPVTLTIGRAGVTVQVGGEGTVTIRE